MLYVAETRLGQDADGAGLSVCCNDRPQNTNHGVTSHFWLRGIAALKQTTSAKQARSTGQQPVIWSVVVAFAIVGCLAAVS